MDIGNCHETQYEGYCPTNTQQQEQNSGGYADGEVVMALAKDLGSVPSTHLRQPTTPVPGDLALSQWVLAYL